MVLEIHEYLKINDQDKIQCKKCGHVYCSKTENYKMHALMSEASPVPSGQRPKPKDFTYREFYCPGCLTLLEVEVAKPNDPILWDTQIF
jgi:acetone carboxylase gamma subunit